MYLQFPWHRYRLPIFLFSFCLSAVLWLSPATSKPAINQQLPISSKPTGAEAIAPTALYPLSLTQNVRQTILDNGLTVLTKEVHSAPVVTVQVWYGVGSRQETAGLSGIAHQLEHMLFKGTTSRPIQFGRLFSALGSESNAFTSYDQTAYYGTVERNKLEALLVLEADRMQNALIDPEQLASEKRVVISELQGYENYPSYRLNHAVMQAFFPDFIYKLPVGGTKADVEGFTLKQVRDYYHTYYRPDNATLVIVGDFQTESTLKAVQEIFGQIPVQNSKFKIPSSKSQVQHSKSQRRSLPIVLKEPGSASLLQVIYPLPEINHPDVPALAVLDYILTAGRSSRLYQALVESGLASDASGSTINLVAGGWYELSATAAPGKELAKIDLVMKSMIAELAKQQVTEEELHRAKAQLQANVILQNRDITSQAIQLGYDQTTAGDYHYTDRYLAAVTQVQAADIQRVAQTYFNTSVRATGYFEPTRIEGKAKMANAAPMKAENFSPGAPIDPVQLEKYLPTIPADKLHPNQALPQKFTLANGLQILLLPDASTPTVTLSGYIAAGNQFDPPSLAGLADLTANNLLNGTANKDGLAIAKILENRGASLSFSTNREGVNISGYSLTSDLPTVIQILAEAMQNATFPQDELERSRQRAIASLRQALDSPWYLSQRILQQTIYPENHPFHIFPTEETISRINQTEVLRFYREQYRPEQTAIALVGNFNPQVVQELLAEQLGSWQVKGNPVILHFPKVSLPESLIRLNPVIPGKSQAAIEMGYSGINRQDPRYYPALVLNQILGGDTLASRLGTELRDRLGLTYGIYSSFSAGQNPGLFAISMQTAPEDAQKAIANTLILLNQLRQEGFTSYEVAAAKVSLTSTYNVTLANPDYLAEQVLRNEVLGLAPEEIQTFSQKIQAITLDQVNQTAQELLHPDRLVVVTAGPAVAASRN